MTQASFWQGGDDRTLIAGHTTTQTLGLSGCLEAFPTTNQASKCTTSNGRMTRPANLLSNKNPRRYMPKGFASSPLSAGNIQGTPLEPRFLKIPIETEGARWPPSRSKAIEVALAGISGVGTIALSGGLETIGKASHGNARSVSAQY